MILINDIKRHNDTISHELKKAINRVLKSGWYILGQEGESFESEFAQYCDVEHCVGVASGTDALELALRAIGVTRGDIVATVANAGGYSSSAILAIGALPLYVDVNAKDMTMSVEVLSDVLISNTKAIIVTHLYGQMADMPGILEVAISYNIPVIEDCAQAHGAILNRKRAGSWGVMGCYSFYPTKNLGALGDGGAIITSDKGLSNRLRQLRQYGWTQKYHADVAGGRNSRLDELQAAVLRMKLPHLDKWNEKRREIAQRISAGLQGLELILPEHFDADYVVHLYVLRTPIRDLLKEKLSNSGIAVDIHYPIPDHRQRMIQEYGVKVSSLPLTERCCHEVLTLPCFPEMSEDEIEYIISAVRDALE